MAKYRRLRVSGATYFFTVALARRGTTLLVDEIGALRQAFSATQAERPFRCDAIVILPDHLHAIWTLPAGDADYSTRLRLMKARFSRAVAPKVGAKHPPYRGGGGVPASRSKRAKGELGIWQRRFWEHCIRDAADYEAHLRYCWANPVKHGIVTHAADWPYSSIHRNIRAGQVAPDWAQKGPDGAFGE